jgi:hypothetical protein
LKLIKNLTLPIKLKKTKPMSTARVNKGLLKKGLKKKKQKELTVF